MLTIRRMDLHFRLVLLLNIVTLGSLQSVSRPPVTPSVHSANSSASVRRLNVARMEDSKIVIIGAGISGLAAADRLINSHKFKNVTILEGSDRIGGRIYPVQIGQKSYVQLGAEWLHNRYNPLFKMAVRFGLVPSAKVKSDDFETGKRLILENGKEVSRRLKNDYKNMVTWKIEKMFEQGDVDGYNAESYGDLIDDLFRRMVEKRKYKEADLKIAQAIHRSERAVVEQFYSTNDWHRASIREYIDEPEDTSIEYEEPDGDEDDVHMNRLGYRTILDDMIRRVSPEKHIRLNSVVRKIRWNRPIENRNRVQLELEDGKIVEADHAIITCSLGYLKKHAEHTFEPKLPTNKMEAIRQFGFDTVEKLILIFDEAFWPKETYQIQLFREGEGNDQAANDDPGHMFEVMFASKTHPNVLTVLIKDGDASAYNRLSDEILANAAAGVLRKYFDKPDIPVPRVYRSSWDTNQFSCGSYSYNTVEADLFNCKRLDLAEPLVVTSGNRSVPTVLFAGEATNPTQYATTHGAYATGIREADRLAKVYKES